MSPLEQELDTFAAGEHTARKAYTFSQEAIDSYEEIGVSSRHRPKVDSIHSAVFPGLEAGQYYDGRMPPNLKHLSLDELSAILSLSCNWHGYISSQFALVSARRMEALARKESIWSIIRNYYRKVGLKWGTKFSDQKLSDFARQDTRFIDANADYVRLNAIYGTLDALVEVTGKEMETISRTVTIRQTKAESEARGRGIRRRAHGNPNTAMVPPEKRRIVSGKTKDRTPKKIKRLGKFRPLKGA